MLEEIWGIHVLAYVITFLKGKMWTGNMAYVTSGCRNLGFIFKYWACMQIPSKLNFNENLWGNLA